MPNEKNTQTVEILRSKVKDAKSITVVDYLGLSVNDINDFRAKLQENGAETVVAKNTLLKIAMEEEGLDTEVAENDFNGPAAAIFGIEDPVSHLKTIFEFAKDLELPKVKFAFIDGVYTEAEKVEIISKLPSKDELLAKVVGGLKSPIFGFVNVLGGTQRKFVTVLSEISKQKE
ncbi:50S ribosomal protein L10 [Patescibacteria group bacterium]